MGKKRGKDKSSRDEEEIDLTGMSICYYLNSIVCKSVNFPFFNSFILIVPSCRHMKKGTDQTLIKKLVSISDWLSCQDCKDEEDKENIDTTQPEDSEGEKQKEATGMWMCLKCGHRVSLFWPLFITGLALYFCLV